MIILYIERERRAAEYQFKCILTDLIPRDNIEHINRNSRTIKTKTGIEFKVISIADIDRIRGLDIAAVFLGFDVGRNDADLIASQVRII